MRLSSVTLRNYRCFGDPSQAAVLAPLTFLVGENSSGKTSLMAAVRALWDVAYDNRVPDFKEEPYDLGSFGEIAHHRGGRGSRAREFEAGFTADAGKRVRDTVDFSVVFEDRCSAPAVARRTVRCGEYCLMHDGSAQGDGRVEVETPSGRWRCEVPALRPRPRIEDASEVLPSVGGVLYGLRSALRADAGQGDIQPLGGTAAKLTDEDIDELRSRLTALGRRGTRPFAGSPVRSQPKRTYDPARVTADAEGDSVPSYLAQLARQEPESWERLRDRLEAFGRSAELFDEIRVRSLGKYAADPFQVQVRKTGKRAKGPFRNLVDVGYGVSQVLPVVADLLRPNGPSVLLLQQPEVHLHPRAQAALGSLFCDAAAPSLRRRPRQLIVETHSDFVIDRARIAVADGEHPLRPEDVSVVYFERSGLETALHSISFDRLGNVNEVPPGYRQFFLDELQSTLSM